MGRGGFLKALHVVCYDTLAPNKSKKLNFIFHLNLKIFNKKVFFVRFFFLKKKRIKFI